MRFEGEGEHCKELVTEMIIIFKTIPKNVFRLSGKACPVIGIARYDTSSLSEGKIGGGSTTSGMYWAVPMVFPCSTDDS